MSKVTTFKCWFGAEDYSITVDLEKSQYYGMIPSEMRIDYLPYYSTIDDHVTKEIANQLNKQLEGERDYVKTGVLLSFVQQNIPYVSDDERFGKDVWETPIYVLTERKADCDGMADLYVSIAHNMGLDVVVVTISGHMFPAVNAYGLHGVKYNFQNEYYYHVETTCSIPVPGRFPSEVLRTRHICKPLTPTEEFKSKLTRYRDVEHS